MKIAVLVSGGIDSLWASILLKESGEDVTAVFGIFTDELYGIKSKVVEGYKSLGIPTICIELIDEFEDNVIEKFVDFYLKGITPNPCCLCNRYIKFGILLKKIKDMGFDAISTGHYVRIIKEDNGKLSVCRGIDTYKDQSYFLSLVPKESFLFSIFPLGEYAKKHVRAEIKKRNITPFVASESQEICFIKNDYRDFLKERGVHLTGPGVIMGMWGENLGYHKGLFYYTIGQRRGLGIPYKEPLYVIDKDTEKNILIVGTKEDLLRDSCKISSINLLRDINTWPREVDVQVNYNMKSKKAVWKKINKDTLELHFKEKLPRPVPGQIGALYNRDILLGGGIICE